MAARNIPHSWSIADWPPDVYPGTPAKGRYKLRAHHDELVRAGALVRIGRELVVIGEKYHRWMLKQASAVPGFECPANRDRAAT